MVEKLYSSPSPRAFSVEKVTGNIGAEVAGVNLVGNLEDRVVSEIVAALVEHKVLIFHDQPMTRAQHIALGRRFGPLEIHPFAKEGFFRTSEDPEVILVAADEKTKGSAESWHSDVTFRQRPSLGAILRCLEAPKFGGDTLWANMETAYDDLDDKTQSFLSGLVAIHDWRHNFLPGLRRAGTSEAEIAGLEMQFPAARHPVVRTHPVSGRKCIFVNPNFTRSIEGMSGAESAALLQRLYQLPFRAEYQVRHRWKPNDVVFWDNRSTQHSVPLDFFPQRRIMERVTLAGDEPF